MKHLFFIFFCFPKLRIISGLNIYIHTKKCFIKQSLYFFWVYSLIFFISILFYSNILSSIQKKKSSFRLQNWLNHSIMILHHSLRQQTEAHLHKAVRIFSAVGVGRYRNQCEKQERKVCLLKIIKLSWDILEYWIPFFWVPCQEIIFKWAIHFMIK